MQTGFYLYGEKCIERLCSIRNPYYTDTGENIYENAYIFLKGSCHIFAHLLHEEFGYGLYKIEKPQLHVFCVKGEGKDMAFIDVRGITSSFEEFKKPFSSQYRLENIEPYTDVDDKDEEGEKFACYLIDKFWSEYVAT